MRTQTARPEWRSLRFAQLVDQLPEAHHVGIAGQLADQLERACAIAVEIRERRVGEDALARLETIAVGDRRFQLAPRRDRIALDYRHLAEAKVRPLGMRIFCVRWLGRCARELGLAFAEL